MNGDVDWGIFDYKFRKNRDKAFENLAYHMFCRKYGMDEGVQADYNNPYLECKPATLANGTVVGFQAKYYETPCVSSKQKNELIEAIEGAKKEYPEIKKIHFYLSRPLSHSKKKGELTSWQKEINEKAVGLKIEIIWVVPSYFEIILNQNDMRDLWEYYFTIPQSESNPYASQTAEEGISSSELMLYYDDVKDVNLRWTMRDGIPKRADFLLMNGLYEIEQSPYYDYVDLLEMILNPTRAFAVNKHADTKFKVIYGASRSGLSFLCETALQTFVHDKKSSEFDNMAYFKITEDDIEMKSLYEKLKEGGKSIFSDDFKNGLLILDGLGKLFSSVEYNHNNVSRVIWNIRRLATGIDDLKVIITVRVNESFGVFELSDEDITCVQNMMIKPEDETFSELMRLPELNNSPESCKIFNNPKRLTLLARLADNPERGKTESEITYQVLREGRDELHQNTAEGIRYSDLAFEIFSKKVRDDNRSCLCTQSSSSDALYNDSILAVEDDKVGFRHSIMFEYYVATYLFELFKSIDGRESIEVFLNRLSSNEISDKRYVDTYLNEFSEDSEENLDCNHERNHELILCFFRDMCLDLLSQTQRDERNYHVFNYICNEMQFHYDKDEESKRRHELAIKNYMKIFLMFRDDFTNEMCEGFKKVFSGCSLDAMCLPDMACNAKVLSRSKFESSSFGALIVGGSVTGSDGTGSGRYRRIDSAYNNNTMQHTDFCKAVIKRAEFLQTHMIFCDFSEIRADKCIFDESIIRNCSFDKAIIENASFKGTQFSNTSFNDMQVNSNAFDGALYFENGEYKELSHDEWKRRGISFLDC